MTHIAHIAHIPWSSAFCPPLGMAQIAPRFPSWHKVIHNLLNNLIHVGYNPSHIGIGC